MPNTAPSSPPYKRSRKASAVTPTATAAPLDPIDQVAEHIESMRNCWPEWDGPQAGGRCQVHQILARNMTQGAYGYHYMAPCEILMEVDDEWICRIDYPPNTPCADLYNGQLLRLPITNIWPPVHALSGRGIISTE